MRPPSDQTPAVTPEAASAGVAITAPAEPDEVARIRRAVGTLGRRTGLSEQRVAEMALAVSEACANVVLHAYIGRRIGALRVTADAVPVGVQVIVADDGRGMTPRSDSPGLGLRLPLISSLTDALEVRAAPEGGTELWMTFASTRPKEPTA